MWGKGKTIAIMLATMMFIVNSIVKDPRNVLDSFIPIIFFISIVWIGFLYDKMKALLKENEDLHKSFAEQNHHLKELNEKLEEKDKILQKREVEIEQFFQNVDVIPFTYDLETETLDVASGIEHIFGYTFDELKEKKLSLLDAIHPDDQHKLVKIREKIGIGQKGKVELQIIKRNFEIGWIALRYSIIKDPLDFHKKIIGVVIDITDRKYLEGKLKQLAYYDALTDLPNRTALRKHLKKAVARSKRHNHKLAIMFIDLDGFKIVNDTIGHEGGDQLLKDVANRLDNVVREEDLVARLGGDEFIIVFEETGENEVEDIAQRIIEDLSNPFQIEEQIATITPSIGISLYPKDGEDADTLVQNADRAMYAVKNSGKSDYIFFTQEMEDIKISKPSVFDKFKSIFTK